MALQHNDPTQPRRKRNEQTNRTLEYWARAPYNFVPLPNQVVTVEEPLPLDTYEGESGWIEYTVETCSPTYTRGILPRDVFDRLDGKKAEDLTEEDKRVLAAFYATNPEDLLEGWPRPQLPGSSLRGMIRSLVEIVTYSKIQWVADTPHVSFRSPAAQGNDPLKAPYKMFLKTLAAGYLKHTGDKWLIVPAQDPSNVGLQGNLGPYIKVKQAAVLAHLKTIPGFQEFDNDDYQVKNLSVSFDVGRLTSAKGKTFKAVTRLADASKTLAYRGVLVCSGNMRETGSAEPSPRRNFALVPPKKAGHAGIEIPESVLNDYRRTLTDFQKREPFDPINGWLKDGAVVFYVVQRGQIAAFGHTPNFRIPALRPGESRASTPSDFVPVALRDDSQLDMADVLFGWAPQENGQRTTSHAGRVFFEDATYTGNTAGVWYADEPIRPQILASPKPTTFQHYLTQDKTHGHDPDFKLNLAHFGTPNNDTAIRGYKLYWHKGRNPQIALEATPEELAKKRKQTTLIRPLKPGVKFAGKIRFENLRPQELGALLWVLMLPGDSGKAYRHKFGMGKPLGMGALHVRVKAIHLTQRSPDNKYRSRYQSLISDNRWFAANREINPQDYLDAFSQYLLKDKKIASDKARLADVPRIQDLLLLLEWRGAQPDGGWLEWTRYMSIEHPQLGNEYGERPVLPTPDGVIRQSRGRRR